MATELKIHSGLRKLSEETSFGLIILVSLTKLN